eukprot:SM000053S17494  [mRNA]  locus=s53:731198:732683:- [translate_table: standard]
MPPCGRAALAVPRAAPAGLGAGPGVAEEGDVVSVHYRCTTEGGEVATTLSGLRGREALCFEVGAGNVIGNFLFKEFDQAVKGMAVGQVARVRSKSPEWTEQLVFNVPEEHAEIGRLRADADTIVEPGALIVLANGEPAVVRKVEEGVVQIDANHLFAGQWLEFDINVVAIEKKR